MGLIDRLRRPTRDVPAQPYECAACGLTFKRRRLNCPACGSAEVRKRRST